MRAAARSAASTFELAAVLAACAAAGGLALAAGVAAGEAEAPGGMGRAAGVAALVPGRWLLVREAAPGWLADGRAGPRAEAARRWLDSLLLLSLASPLAPALGGAAAWEAGHGATALLAAWTLRRAWGVSAAAGLLVLPLATWAVLGAARW